MNCKRERAVRVRRLCAIVLFALGIAACAARRGPASFRVIAANPEYLLRGPDAKNTPFPEVPGQYTDVGSGWVGLRPLMELRIENAYYKEGAPKRGLANYLGTEVARYEVRPNGSLRQLSIESHVERRPSDQPAADTLLPPRQRRLRRHRYFYQVILNRRTGEQSAILLSSDSEAQLARLTTELLTTPESVCGGTSPNCTVFPSACTVALEMEVFENGKRRTVVWGSTVMNIAAHPKQLELMRLHAGRLTPVYINAGDPNALRLPLLPGDRITWR